jgi:pimeloyl-ACP methyl ester carboxylesterase
LNQPDPKAVRPAVAPVRQQPPGAAPEASIASGKALAEVARLSPDEALQKLSSTGAGLTPGQVEQQLRSVGPNRVARQARHTVLGELAARSINPLNILLLSFRPNSALYHDRSPINFIQRLSAPVIFLHGKDDPVVPINQAQKMYSALQRRNIPTCLLVFQEEKHGFRQSAHLRQALEAELLFYSMNLTRAPLTS